MQNYIEEVIKEAKKSLKTDDIPIGCIIVENNKIIARGHNTKEKTKMITRHAEINAIEQACKRKKEWYLNNCTIYTTVEPCEMCLNAIYQSRIKKVFYIIKNGKYKLNDNKKNKLLNKIDTKQEEILKLMHSFFQNKR